MSRIGIDFDGVIVDTSKYKREFLNFLGYNIDYVDKTSIFNYFLGVNKSIDEINKVYKSMSDYVFNNNILFASDKIDDIDFAFEYLTKKNDLFIITNRKSNDIPNIYKWLKMNHLEKYILDIYSSSFTTKAQVCLDNKITVLIDDDRRNLINSSIKNIYFDINKNNWLDVLLLLSENDNLITFIGPPSSGKSTAIRLCNNYDVIATSSLLKKNNIDTSNGNLIVDQLVNNLVINELKNIKSKRIILDGFPRTVGQYEELKKNNYDLTKTIYFKISKDELYRRVCNRLTCSICHESYTIDTFKHPLKENICDICGGKIIKRSDDNEKLFKKRLESYEKNTLPLLNKINDYVVIDQDDSFENIRKKIKKIIL